VRPVVPPTVPAGEERVRVCLRAGIEQDVIKKLVQAIEEWTYQVQDSAVIKAKL
jgi:8-amino-7-oxononanoate synthase